MKSIPGRCSGLKIVELLANNHLIPMAHLWGLRWVQGCRGDRSVWGEVCGGKFLPVNNSLGARGAPLQKNSTAK